MTMHSDWPTRRTFLGGLGAAGVGAAISPASAFQAGGQDPLLAAIDDKADLALLQKMVQIPSFSATKGETPLAKYLVEEMKALGLETELQEVEPGRHNAIGRLRGTGGGRSLMFNGHIDTNPVGELWTVDPLGGVVKDDCVYGIGVSNMKASCAAYVGAVRALVKSKTRLRGDVIVTHVVGELSGGVGTQKVVQSGLKTDYFIVGEPTDLVLLTVHASGTGMTIKTIGVTRHMSKLEESVSAIDTMYKVIDRVRRMTFTDSRTSTPEYASIRRVNIGSMRAGLGRDFNTTRSPQVPDVAEVQVAIRFGPDLTPASVLADVQRELAALHAEDPTVVAEVEGRSAPPSPDRVPYEIAKDHPLVQTVADAYRKVVGQEPSIGPVGPSRFYGTDAPRLQAAGMAGLVCGVGGKYNTMPDERVELKDYHAATRIYALTAMQLCR